jgi:WD40 repeat protein
MEKSFENPISDFLLFDDNRIFLGDLKGNLSVIDHSFNIISKQSVHKNAIRTVLGLSDSSIVTSSSSGFISFFDLEKFKISKRFRCRNVAISTMVAIDENVITFGDDFGALYSMDKRKKKALINSTKSLSQDYISSIIKVPNEKDIVVTSGDGTIAQLEPFQMKIISKSQNLNAEITCATLFDSEGKIICCCTDSGVINLFKFSEYLDPFYCIKTNSEIVSCCKKNDQVLTFSDSNGRINILENNIVRTQISLPFEFDSIVKTSPLEDYFVSQEENMYRFTFSQNSNDLLSGID